MTTNFAARRLLSAALALALIGSPLTAQVSASAAPSAASATPRPWFYEQSDVPMDPAWHFGELPNGLRYAIRRNDVPAGQVSVRVRVDVGSLMEEPAEAGFAHFIEHLSFRGSRDVPDGESKRIWQRLGATFGSDTNAQTTPTGTTYALDLPRANEAGIDESLKILAGMLSQPNIAKAPVEAERAVVMAERREGLSPQSRVGDEIRSFYYAGQRLGKHSTIGTEATLAAATPQALNAFHDRWYRPDRTVIAISGAMDPALLEAKIRAHFSGWKAQGPATPLPDFGKPDPRAPATKVVVEPSAPYTVGLAYLRPWTFNADTVAFNQARLADMVALELINRRLEVAASQGASFLQASVALDNSSRSVNATYVTIVPVGNEWEKALKEVRAIVEDARKTAPSQTDIDREFSGMQGEYAALVASADIEGSARQAEDLVSAVDIRETVVSPATQLEIYRSARSYMTPDKLLASTRRLFSASAVRALLSLKTAQPNALARLTTALRAPVQAATNARLGDKAVTMASLPALPPPGKVVSRTPVGIIGIQNIAFDNGVRLLLVGNKAEPGKVHVKVRFGHGRESFSPKQDDALWAAPFGIAASGIGDVDQRGLAELMNGRRLGFDFGIDDDAFTLSATSSPEDYADQLRLFATKLAFPRWDEAPLKRAMAALEAGYDPVPGSASDAIERNLDWMLRDRDGRYSPAAPSDRAALTLDKFKALWAPRLASGPIEVQIYGDVDTEAAIQAVAATFGALPKREDLQPPPENRAMHFPRPVSSPVLLSHTGPSEQAAAIIAWPTGGGTARIRESRQLEMLARLISDRLFEKLRSIDGAAYTPSASSIWPETSDSGGYLFVQTQLKPDRIPYFFQLMNEIAADLASKPVTQDELDRQVEPIRQLLNRAAYSNAFWMSQLEGYTTDPRKLGLATSLARDLLDTTPADIQALAARYLVPGQSWSAIVLARGMPVPLITKQQTASGPAAQAAGGSPAPASH
ncbi:M16 family metallopeptidase [Sphingobium nicotianae]|uniref:Insulinase family protein n=1 Tax=Sphingobium nicotianae TaxID=2782607 RepID=A0A9X1IRM6_9SPHN|nr:insulinase family protein [Sphingobium nicotianae]MBT2187588.1 insulinase family protein [Sphingobium nicotianae]